MTDLELFRALSYVSAENLAGVEALQGDTLAPRRKTGTHLFLIAAAIALSLLLVGCAVAYSSGWFQRVFSARSDSPLSADQIQYLERNEQPVGQSQGNDGWNIELKSTISDGTVGYLVFQVTAPSGTDLEQYLNPPTVQSKHLTPGNYSHSKKAAYSMVIASIGSISQEQNYMYLDGGSWLPDNDGQHNTVLYCMTIRCNKLYPERPMGLAQPFGKDISFRIRFMGVCLDYTNTAIAESIDAQYAGQEYFVDGDALAGLFCTDVLTDEEWNFEVTLDADNQFAELISQPTAVQARVFYYADAGQSTAIAKQEAIPLRSFRVTPFGASVAFDLPPDTNGASILPDSDSQIYAVMKDGSRIVLLEDQDKLLAQSPIVLSELDYILLADGTKLPAANIQMDD